MISCEKHPDRDGTLRIDLPSIGVKQFLCEECNEALVKRLSTAFKGKREAWETQDNDMEWIYQGRTGSELHQGKWK